MSLNIGAHILADHQAPASKAGEDAFALQYISLILIVLCTIVGSFRLDAAKIAAEVRSPSAKPAGVLFYSDLFQTGESQIDETKLAAVSEFLLNHDISAKITVNLPQEINDPELQITLGLARSRTVFHALQKSGVPVEALEVWTAELRDPSAQIELDFTQERL